MDLYPVHSKCLYCRFWTLEHWCGSSIPNLLWNNLSIFQAYVQENWEVWYMHIPSSRSIEIILIAELSHDVKLDVLRAQHPLGWGWNWRLGSCLPKGFAGPTVKTVVGHHLLVFRGLLHPRLEIVWGTMMLQFLQNNGMITPAFETGFGRINICFVTTALRIKRKLMAMWKVVLMMPVSTRKCWLPSFPWWKTMLFYFHQLTDWS